MAAIEVRSSSRSFWVVDREAGTREAIGSSFRRRLRDVPAIDDVACDIDHSGVVASGCNDWHMDRQATKADPNTTVFIQPPPTRLTASTRLERQR